MKIGKRNVSIKEYENYNARIIGGLEALTGLGLIVGTHILGKDTAEKILLYTWGTGALISGTADLISGRIGYSIDLTANSIGYVRESIKSFGDKLKMKKKNLGGRD